MYDPLSWFLPWGHLAISSLSRFVVSTCTLRHMTESCHESSAYIDADTLRIRCIALFDVARWNHRVIRPHSCDMSKASIESPRWWWLSLNSMRPNCSGSCRWGTIWHRWSLRTFDLSFLTILQGMLLCEHWFLHICKMRKVSYRFIEYTRNYTCDLCDYMWLHYIALQHAALSGDPPLLQISGLPLTVAFHLTYPYLPLPAFRSSPVQCFSFWSSQLIVMSLCNLRNFRITYIVQKYSRTSYIVLYKFTQ